jgi:hypothetical protein
MITSFLQTWLWMPALRIMQLDAEPPVMQWLDVAANIPYPFSVCSLWNSVRLGQHTWKITPYVNKSS